MDRDISLGTLEASAVAPSAPVIEPQGARLLSLQQIAAALDIPVEAFARPEGQHGIRARVLAENAEALTIFSGITDAEARQRGLAYLRWIATQSNGG